VKALKVSYDKGKTYVLPSVAAAKNKTYPINRPLYYYYLSSIEKTVGPFVNFVLSPAGQQLVMKTGYVPL
jgi:phosphate transport system substrate-binding protein